MNRSSLAILAVLLTVGGGLVFLLAVPQERSQAAGRAAADDAPARDKRPLAAPAGPAVMKIDTPLSPPTWALLQRELLRANTSACKEFYARYFDERGYLLCVERWGGNDGPDDAIENCAEWPLLHALGAPDPILALYRKAWEGHLRQYTQAKTTRVPMARDGMYYKEFPVSLDWLHHAEGLTAFNLEGLADPHDERFRARVRRFAGFYLNDDPGAPNYDPKHRIIRSLFNGSRGPLLRKATGLDWAGDPIELKDRFQALHGERTYEEMLAHFKDYTDIVGDHPQNLLATTLALNAYLLTHEERYRRWLLDYVDAWRQRMSDNGGIIPTNIGLDGKIGSSAGGKWYGGAYGWGFTVTVPQTGALAHRNTHYLGFTGFANAYLLTGDLRYLDPWARQIDRINAQRKMQDGKWVYPHMFGDKGWYHFTPEPYAQHAPALYYLSQRKADHARLSLGSRDGGLTVVGGAHRGWFSYLEGRTPDYPEQALRRDLAWLRHRVQAMRKDDSTPDTRLSDNPLQFTPASIESLVELMLGGLLPGRRGSVLHCRVRYFDPVRRRAGIPEDVAALVEKIAPNETTLTLVNVNQLESRRLILQAGAYGEHRIVEARQGTERLAAQAPWLAIELAPGAGARIVLGLERHAATPTLAFPPGM